MSYITTFTGKRFDPVRPDENLIDIADIAHALSLLCRANGHIAFFYSVAQHSIACAREAMARNASREIVLGALLHDASEAYLSDVTRPVKKDLPYYLEVEDKLQSLIWRHFIGRDLTDEEKRAIFEIDDRMLSMEFHQMMKIEIDDSYTELLSEVICKCENPQSVESEFVGLAGSGPGADSVKKGVRPRAGSDPGRGQTPNATLQYYDRNAAGFVENTLTADMSEAYSHFLAHLPRGGHILDLGCGSGRDAKHFLDLGYRVDATDGSEELCRRASEHAGIPVRRMLFQELSAVNLYDGIWACSSILHLAKPELLDVLKKTAAALKSGGVLYTSFKWGTSEGVRNGRYFTDFTEENLRDFWKGVPELPITELWITADVRPGRGDERWINLLATRV